MRWQFAPTIDEVTKVNLQDFSPVIAQLLFNRDITTKQSAEQFFSTYPFGDHMAFHNIEKAAQRIKKAIDHNEKILLHGDYDVDGITSTAILYDYLTQKHHANIIPFIPNRFTDGYGVKEKTIQQYIKQGISLVITVDCGIREEMLMEKLKDSGVDFIITDHHTPSDTFPSCHALVHPTLGYTFPHLSGAAVAWKLLSAIEALYPTNTDPQDYLDLVALGIVCDQMPLVEENRTIVKTGLEKLRYTKRIGLMALMEEAAIPFVALNTYHIGFVIGPRLNAGGRLETAMDGFHLLVTHDKQEAQRLARKLSQLNTQRQEYTKRVTQEALAYVEKYNNQSILVAKGDDWPEGVIGIAAGKVFEITGKPTIVLTKKHSKYVGSCRSSEACNIVAILTQAQELLTTFGGHAAAAGLTIEEENIPAFTQRINELAPIQEKTSDKTLHLDMPLQVEAITWDTLKEITQFAPFGNKNPSPLFSLSSMRIAQVASMGENGKHLRFKLVHPQFPMMQPLGAVAFNMGHLIPHLAFGSIIDIAFSLEENVWNQKRHLQLNIKDIHLQ